VIDNACCLVANASRPLVLVVDARILDVSVQSTLQTSCGFSQSSEVI
jgi:hypothetical protein